MSVVVLSYTTPRARKQHRCIWCGEAIVIGEHYVNTSLVWEGSIDRQHWHYECKADAQYDGGEEFTPYVNERPVEELKEEDDPTRNT